MIPEGLQWVLEEGRVVEMDGGSGPTTVRRLADLILPTGRLLIGYPGSPMVNEPSPFRPMVGPGRYPVFAAVANLSTGFRDLAFVVVCFQEAQPLAWEEAGSFFTDSGTGCLMDEGNVPLLETRRSDTNFWRLLYDLEAGVFGEGDCNLVLDELSGANAIVFATHDSRYPCFLGTGRDGGATWLVVDCR